MLDFWASWCGPCAESFPWMAEMQEKYGAQGLVVVAVNLDEDQDAAAAFLGKHRAGFQSSVRSWWCHRRIGRRPGHADVDPVRPAGTPGLRPRWLPRRAASRVRAAPGRRAPGSGRRRRRDPLRRDPRPGLARRSPLAARHLGPGGHALSVPRPARSGGGRAHLFSARRPAAAAVAFRWRGLGAIEPAPRTSRPKGCPCPGGRHVRPAGPPSMPRCRGAIEEVDVRHRRPLLRRRGPGQGRQRQPAGAADVRSGPATGAQVWFRHPDRRLRQRCRSLLQAADLHDTVRQ